MAAERLRARAVGQRAEDGGGTNLCGRAARSTPNSRLLVQTGCLCRVLQPLQPCGWVPILRAQRISDWVAGRVPLAGDLFRVSLVALMVHHSSSLKRGVHIDMPFITKNTLITNLPTTIIYRIITSEIKNDRAPCQLAKFSQ